MKVKLFSHIADVDGLTPVVLAKQVFENLDYELLEIEEVEKRIQNFLKEITNYDKVYLTDINISRELAELIEAQEEYRNRVVIIDHHIGKIDMNDFSFVQVVDTDSNGIKQSATSLFFQYLLKISDSPILRKPVLLELVEKVRKMDTWTWQGDIDAKRIETFKSIYGKDYYITYWTEYIKIHDTFAYDQKDILLFEIEEQKIKEYIEEQKEKVISLKIGEFHIGVIFAEKYISELGNALSEYYQDQYDFMAMIKISTGKISYRAVKEEISVIPFAQKHGGNGHKHAAGSPLPADIYKQILHLIFPEGEIRE